MRRTFQTKLPHVPEDYNLDSCCSILRYNTYSHSLFNDVEICDWCDTDYFKKGKYGQKQVRSNSDIVPLDIATLWCFSSTVHHSIELLHQPILMHNFLYSLTICLLNYYPRHVSSINMTIFRRKNCIHTASVIFALCKRLHSTPVESGLSPLSTSVLCRRLQRAKIPDAVWIQFFLLKMGILMLETCRG